MSGGLGRALLADPAATLDAGFRPLVEDLGWVVDGVVALRRVVGVRLDGTSVRYEVRSPRGVRLVARFYLEPGREGAGDFPYDVRSVDGSIVSRGEARSVEYAVSELDLYEGSLLPPYPLVPARAATILRSESAVVTLGLARGLTEYPEVVERCRVVDPERLVAGLPGALSGHHRSSEDESLRAAEFLEDLTSGVPVEWALRRLRPTAERDS